MLFLTLLVLVVLGILFTVMALVFDAEGHYVEKLFCGMFAIFIWFATGVSSISIDFPYTHLFENSDNSSYLLIEGTQRLSGIDPGLPWVYMGLGILMLVYVWYSLFRKSMEVVSE